MIPGWKGAPERHAVKRLSLGLSNIAQILIVRCIFRAQISPKSVFDRAPPRTPLGELTAHSPWAPFGWGGGLRCLDLGASHSAPRFPVGVPRRCGVRRTHYTYMVHSALHIDQSSRGYRLIIIGLNIIIALVSDKESASLGYNNKKNRRSINVSPGQSLRVRVSF